MSDLYGLGNLDPYTFEHLANTLALRVLGMGHTTFGPGRDGGRDGYYEGEAPYPSDSERWRGVWYLQSKFHKPHLTSNAQKWVIDQIESEITSFSNDEKRSWPDNWIVVTNVDISASPETGTFDRARALVVAARPQLDGHFHIWGGSKIAALLAHFPDVASYYAHFTTPGHVLTELKQQLSDERASVESILRFLILKQMEDHQFTRLEQAGAGGESRPGIHRLFIDLPFSAPAFDTRGMVMQYLLRASARPHRVDANFPDTPQCRNWRRHPARARVWFVKAGPGHGKSTIGQYFCQVARASLALADAVPRLTLQQRTLAEEIREAAVARDQWPSIPRIPIAIDLKDYAQWYSRRTEDQARGILTFVADRISVAVEQSVLVGTLKRMLRWDAWLVIFDGLDEVPHDVKDAIAGEVLNFLNNVSTEAGADLLTICTSRPQGYSGQFADIDGPMVELASLTGEQAIACAAPLLRQGRSDEEYQSAMATLLRAIESPSVRELMTTPLQSHIMAVIVRDGGRPPERRWQLYSRFYDVIRKREANKNFPDKRLSKLLREDERLLKTVHARLGFVLHARAERSEGAQTQLTRTEFGDLVRTAVRQLVDREVEPTVETLMAATEHRLVLVNTPDDGDHLRFDIRPLQEFFAAEFLYEDVEAAELEKRLALVAGDSHWREVLHFLLSALVEGLRRTELTVAIRILEGLNGDDAEGENRVCLRRLARGALVASRLLIEGVLEQDKKVRGEFRRALEPLFASTDWRLLQPTTVLRRPSSLDWFAGTVHDAISESSPAESLGAGAVAVAVDVDADAADKLVQLLLERSSGYIDDVLAVTGAEGTAGFVPSNVGFQLAIRLLSSRRWRELQPESIDALLACVRVAPRERLEQQVDAMGEAARELVTLTDDRLSRRRVPTETATVADFGVVTAFLPTLSWATAGVNALPLLDVEPTCDFVRAVMLVREFYNRPSIARLKEVFEFLDADGINALPPDVRILLPLPTSGDTGEHVALLTTLTDDELHVLLRTGELNGRPLLRLPLSFVWAGQYRHDGWKALVNQDLRLALSVWNGDVMRSGVKGLASRRAVEVLINRLIREPETLVRRPGAWGRLVRMAPHRERELRSALLRAARELHSVPPSFGAFEALRIDIGTEAALLPYLLSAALSPSLGFFNVDATMVRERLSETIGRPVTREYIKARPEITGRARAALLFAAIIEGASVEPEDCIALIEGVDESDRTWVFQIFARVTALLGTKETREARAMLGRMLTYARENLSARFELDDVLWRWRETSRAPVSTAGVAAQWLSGA